MLGCDYPKASSGFVTASKVNGCGVSPCLHSSSSSSSSPSSSSSSFTPQDCFHTNPVARSFSPEFSHHFAIALPLDGGGGVRPALAEALLQGMAVFEVWHKVDQMVPQVSVT